MATILAIGLMMSLLPNIGIEKAYAADDIYNTVWIDTDGKEMTAAEKANWEYTYDDYNNRYSLKYKGSIWDGKIKGKVPAIINEEAVTDMSGTFFDMTDLTEAPVIPDSVTNMGGTFYGCRSLKKAPVIPGSVTSMYNTFHGCTNLTEAPIIPDSVTNMYGTFEGCTSLKSYINTEVKIQYGGQIVTSTKQVIITIPDSVTDMNSTFKGCTGLVTPPIIGNKVKDMTNTFCECTNLTKAPIIPDSVTEMYGTFSKCTNLTEAPIIPDSVTNMNYAFENCQQLFGKVNIPEQCKDDKTIFKGCNAYVIGKVTDYSGNAIENVKLVFKKQYTPTKEVVTDFEGKYEASLYQDTTYDVKIYLNEKLEKELSLRTGITENVIKNIYINTNESSHSITGAITSDSFILNDYKVTLYKLTNNIATEAIDTVSNTYGSNYTFADLPNGDYALRFTAMVYNKNDNLWYNYTGIKKVTVSNENVTQDFNLDANSCFNVSGTVSNVSNSEPISGATVETKGQYGISVGTVTTDDQGQYQVPNLPAGNYTLEVTNQEEAKTKSFTITNKDEVLDISLGSQQTEIEDPDVPLGPTPVDGKVNGNMPVYGTVNPINIIDVTLPISMTFVIKADRTLQKPQDIKIESNCPAPLNTCILSINKSDNAPGLVAPDTYTDEQWNNLTKAKTYKEIALTMNGEDLSKTGNSLGNLRSAFNAADPSTPNTQELNLDLDVKYGKAWNNSQDYTFTYNTVFEFSML